MFTKTVIASYFSVAALAVGFSASPKISDPQLASCCGESKSHYNCCFEGSPCCDDKANCCEANLIQGKITSTKPLASTQKLALPSSKAASSLNYCSAKSVCCDSSDDCCFEGAPCCLANAECCQ